jgi:hypothetical protein
VGIPAEAAAFRNLGRRVSKSTEDGIDKRPTDEWTGAMRDGGARSAVE